MTTDCGRSPDGSGYSAEPEPISVVSAVPVSIPNADCAECERLREEIADYMGHRTDSVAGKLWAAQHLFSRFEDTLEGLIGDFDKLGHDDYDQSLEIYGAAEDVRLDEDAQRLIRDAGFGTVYVNHGKAGDQNCWQTHYTLHKDELPVRGWRRRYVSDPSVSTTRVISGDEDNGYYEISYWPEGWNSPRTLADLESGYYRIVPDPLDPFALAAATRRAKTPKAVECEASQSGAAKTAQRPTSVASSDKERE